MDSKWGDGVWFGIDPFTNAHLIGNKDGVFQARTVKPRPDLERWNADAVSAFSQGVEGSEQGICPVRIRADVEEVPVVEGRFQSDPRGPLQLAVEVLTPLQYPTTRGVPDSCRAPCNVGGYLWMFLSA